MARESAHEITSDVIADTIAQLLGQRSAAASICPSEVARALAPDDWRKLMAPIRAVAAQLSLAGALSITQGPTTIDPNTVLDGTVRGPLRLRHR